MFCSRLSRLIARAPQGCLPMVAGPDSVGSATESSPDVPKTVNQRPAGEFFLRVPQQLDEAPLKLPFLACNSTILGLPLERSS